MCVEDWPGIARNKKGSITMTSVKSEVEMAAKPETFISPKPEPVLLFFIIIIYLRISQRRSLH